MASPPPIAPIFEEQLRHALKYLDYAPSSSSPPRKAPACDELFKEVDRVARNAASASPPAR